MDRLTPDPMLAYYKPVVTLNQCHSGRDGDCTWEQCPQLRDNEP
jgi:hypothetical protein